MTEHIFDELPSLLSGQSTREDLIANAAHLRTCTDCQQELINAVVAHSSLSSAARFTPGVLPAVLTRLSGTGSLAEQSLSDEPEALHAPRHNGADSEQAALPDLSSLFAAVRQEAGDAANTPAEVAPVAEQTSIFRANRGSVGTGERAVRTSRGWSARWLVAAAVVGLGLGSAAVLGSHQFQSTPSSTTVALAAYGVGSTPATAKVISNDDMKLDASTLPTPGNGALYEVWLTNDSRTKMHALGWINSDGKGEFTVPPELMKEYSAIEVSVQQLNSSYEYSGKSVLRGTY